MPEEQIRFVRSGRFALSVIFYVWLIPGEMEKRVREAVFTQHAANKIRLSQIADAQRDVVELVRDVRPCGRPVCTLLPDFVALFETMVDQVRAGEAFGAGDQNLHLTSVAPASCALLMCRWTKNNKGSQAPERCRPARKETR